MTGFLNRKIITEKYGLGKNKPLFVLLILTAVLYICVLVVRTWQASIAVGEKINAYSVSQLILKLPIPLTSDQLRFISYVFLVLISALYGIVILFSSKIKKNLDEKQEKRIYLIWVILPYVFLGLITLLFYPHVSSPLDTVDYTMHARILTTYSRNPFTVAGASFPQDQLVNFMEAKNRPSVYGPIWEYISVIPAWIGSGKLVNSIIAFKVLFWMAGLIILSLIWIFHHHPSIHPAGQVFVAGAMVAWNPMIHFVSHGDGHNDILMAFFIALMLVALVYRRPIIGFVNYALSVFVKYISGPLFIPLSFYIFRTEENKSRLKKIILMSAGLLICVLMAFLAYAPFGITSTLGVIAGRYSGLAAAQETSKATILTNILTILTSRLGISISKNGLTTITSLVFPTLWIIYVLIRSFSIQTINDLTKIVIETCIFFVTFVAMPAYAQYVITPVLIMGFLFLGNWHRVAVLLISLAYLWDQFYIVYLPAIPLNFEKFLHIFSHLLVLLILILYFITRIWMKRISPLKTKKEFSSEND